jgi:hypothetical protein
VQRSLIWKDLDSNPNSTSGTHDLDFQSSRAPPLSVIKQFKKHSPHGGVFTGMKNEKLNTQLLKLLNEKGPDNLVWKRSASIN